MENSQEKIKLPRELQLKMLNFFIKTSVPRNKLKNNKSSIKNK